MSAKKSWINFWKEVFEYHVYDEDENCYNDEVTEIMEISNPYQYQTEKEYSKQLEGV